MSNLLSLVIIFVNISHMLFYLHLATRNPIRFLLLYISIPGLWLPVLLINNAVPALTSAVGLLYVVCCLLAYRVLVTCDNFNRIFLTGFAVLAFAQIIRLPPTLVMVHGYGMSKEECANALVYVIPVLFLLLTPLLLLYVRKKAMMVLDMAESQRWYLVGLPPLLLTVLGAIISFMLTETPETPGVLAASILMPAIVVAYFLSMYLFLVNRNEKLILRQRLLAAEQLENTYKFYSTVLGEKENRLRTLRHDFRHLALHLNSLAEKGEMDGLRPALRSALHPDAGEVAITPLCENHTVNAVVSFHFAAAEKLGVNCVANAFVPATIPMPDADMALVLGNALENCVKGAGPLGETGYITFTAKPVKRCLVFTFANNYDKRAFAKGEGAGLTSIRQLCERHQATVEVADTGTEFTLRLYLLMA